MGVTVEALLQRVQQAGLRLLAEGTRLRVRGPRRAEPLVREVRARKKDVLTYLNRQTAAELWEGAVKETSQLWNQFNNGDDDKTSQIRRDSGVLSSPGSETTEVPWLEERTTTSGSKSRLPRRSGQGTLKRPDPQ